MVRAAATPISRPPSRVPVRLPTTGGATVTLDVALVGVGLLAVAAGLALAYVGRRKAA